MFNILVLDNVSKTGLAHFPQDRYAITDKLDMADAILCRSSVLHDYSFPERIKVVGRAGAGVNNIPITKLTEKGIPVLNTPGANANAVKELVLAGLLLASRNICQAWQYSKGLQGDEETMAKMVEKGKKQYVGTELTGRTLGVVGLGSIGVLVANAAIDLGMRVIGYDPQLTVKHAWQLSSQVEAATTLDALLPQVDYLTLHVPLLPNTRGLMNENYLGRMKPGTTLLNFSRDAIVDNQALATALDNHLMTYVCDFPSPEWINHPKVIALPHLGASTVEAEENCAVMIVEQVRHFLEDGNISNSVNFPEAVMPRMNSTDVRLAICNHNVPNMVAQISSVLAQQQLNIVDLLNKSREGIAHTLINVHERPSTQTLQALQAIKGVMSVRICDQ